MTGVGTEVELWANRPSNALLRAVAGECDAVRDVASSAARDVAIALRSSSEIVARHHAALDQRLADTVAALNQLGGPVALPGARLASPPVLQLPAGPRAEAPSAPTIEPTAPWRASVQAPQAPAPWESAPTAAPPAPWKSAPTAAPPAPWESAPTAAPPHDPAAAPPLRPTVEAPAASTAQATATPPTLTFDQRSSLGGRPSVAPSAPAPEEPWRPEPAGTPQAQPTISPMAAAVTAAPPSVSSASPVEAPAMEAIDQALEQPIDIAAPAPARRGSVVTQAAITMVVVFALCFLLLTLIG